MNFEDFINEPNPEHWRGFPELMWKLGFEMDCYQSAPDFDERDYYELSEKERQDQLLAHMTQWSVQEVGNYIFSRYRELTHWSDYGYPEEKGAYFFERAFPILQQKLDEEWEERNIQPNLEEFTELVIKRLSNRFEDEKLIEFVLSDEGLYHLKNKYNECLKRLESRELTVPMLRHRGVSEVVFLLKEMY